MSKYLKVMFGTKSGASDFEYKLGEVNVAKIWNPKELDPKKWEALILVQNQKY
ncbi:MAG: hypothetical protein U0M05_02190 [Clostridia bacterium]|nr:hypothetical protein [Clostridia bacterium]